MQLLIKNKDFNDNLIDEIKLWRLILEFVKGSSINWAIEDIQSYLLSTYELKTCINKKDTFWKNKLSCRFKKLTGKLILINMNKLAYVRRIFINNIFNALKHKHLLISIEEWLISRSTIREWGWAPWGQTREVSNGRIDQSIKIIAAIISNGHYIVKLIHKTLIQNSLLSF